MHVLVVIAAQNCRHCSGDAVAAINCIRPVSFPRAAAIASTIEVEPIISIISHQEPVLIKCDVSIQCLLILATSGLSLATSGLRLETSGLSLATSGLRLETSGLSLATSGLSLATSGLCLAQG
jgi:hypothetical protein